MNHREMVAKPEIRPAILAACARMLSYPDSGEFISGLDEVREGMQDFPGSVHDSVLSVIDTLVAQDRMELAQEYVMRFDLAKETTLHLTAQEQGDDRERGSALLQLAQLFQAAGCLPSERQLSDYIPQLLEFLAMLEAENAQVVELEHRIARVCKSVEEKLLGQSVYGEVFVLLNSVLRAANEVPPTTVGAVDQEPGTGTPKTQDDGESEDDMPYPLHYLEH